MTAYFLKNWLSLYFLKWQKDFSMSTKPISIESSSTRLLCLTKELSMMLLIKLESRSLVSMKRPISTILMSVVDTSAAMKEYFIAQI